MQNNTFSRLSLRQNLIVLDEVSSTNDYLKELLSNIKPLTEATAIMAKHQTKGKGQRGSIWLSSKDENLTFSFHLHPDNLGAHKSFHLNMLICLGIQHALVQYGLQTTVKWPNDIYVGNKKIGGVLIENKLAGSMIHSSIIGIGLNVNQRSFPTQLMQKATSLRLETQTDSPIAIDEFCIDILYGILQYYQEHDIQHPDSILTAYNNGLYRRALPSRFLVHNREVTGSIAGVDLNGRLCVHIDGEPQYFDLKEIRFII